MDKIKEYREYIILIGISILLLLYIIFRSAGNINYKLPVTENYNEDEINHITISSPQIELDLVKMNGQWFLQPENWEADNSNPIAIAKELANLKITDLISTSGNKEVYELDQENRSTVKAYIDNKLVREIYVGKVSQTGIYTYIQLPDDKNVYSVRGNLPSRVKDKKSMRNKEFLSIKRDSVNKLELAEKNGLEISLTKDATTLEWSSTDIEADNEAIKSAVNILDPLRCVDFINKQTTKADWTINIITTEGTSSLSIWKPVSGKNYIAQNSTNGYFVTVSPYSIEKILTAFGYDFDK